MNGTSLIDFGDHWNVVESFHCHDGEYISELKLQDACRDEVKAFAAHPSLIDCSRIDFRIMLEKEQSKIDAVVVGAAALC